MNLLTYETFPTAASNLATETMRVEGCLADRIGELSNPVREIVFSTEFRLHQFIDILAVRWTIPGSARPANTANR